MSSTLTISTPSKLMDNLISASVETNSRTYYSELKSNPGSESLFCIYSNIFTN